MSPRHADVERNEALARILTEAESGELVFPTHAEVALRVRLALEDPQLHLEAAVQLVQAEPLLAARVVALANSVAFNRSSQTVDQVKSAVSILGVQMVRLLATALIMSQMVGNTASPLQRELGERLWQHSSQIAALAHVLARRLTTQAPDMALFGGMVHEIGGFYMISRASVYPKLLAGSGAASWTEIEAGRVNHAVLRALQVPAPLIAAIDGLGRARLTLPPVGLDEILFVAHQLSPLEDPLTAGAAADPDRLELRRLVGADTRLGALLTESQRELQSLIAALQL